MSESRAASPAAGAAGPGSKRPAGPTLLRAAARGVGVLLLLLIAVLAGVHWHAPLGGLLGWSSSAEHGKARGAAAPQLWTCSMHPQVIRDGPGDCPICHMKLEPLRSEVASPGAAAEVDGDSADVAQVRIDPVVVQNMGVRTAEVRRGPLRRSFRVVGFLEEPEPNHLDISPRVSGWIEALHANVDGMEVRRGDPLFDLYSPELSVAIEELIATRALAEHGSSAHLRDAVVGKLRALGLDAAEIERLGQLDAAPPSVTFRSPWDAHVTERRVYAGSAVAAGDLVLRLADRSTMWLNLEVHEQQLPFFGPGRAVQATLDAVPGEVFEGVIDFIHPHVNEMTRTAMVRARIDNPTHVLRQGMYAIATVEALLAEETPLAPREAVIDTGMRQIAFVVHGTDSFEPRPVRMGLAGDDGVVQILEGLAPGERVVTSGQFLIDSESRLREALARSLHEGLLLPPAAAASGEHAAPPAPAPHDHGARR